MKIINKLMLLIMLLTICTVPAYAEEEIKVMVNGEYIETVQPPINVEGRVLAPVREICEAFDCTVEWNDGTICVRNQIMRVDLSINSYYILKRTNNKEEEIKLDVPPILYNGKTLLPVRALAEAFGAKVEWIDTEKCVAVEKEIYYPGLMEGYYITELMEKNGIIDSNGNEILPTIYDRVFIGDGGDVLVQKGEKYASYNLNQKRFVTDFIYDNMNAENCGIIPVLKDGLWGAIDENGNECIDFIYTKRFMFKGDYAFVQNDDGIFQIDKNQNIIRELGKSYGLVTPTEFKGNISDYYVAYKRKGEQVWMGILDINCNVLIPVEYDDVKIYGNKYVRVEQDEKCGLLTIDNEIIYPVEYDNIDVYEEEERVVLRKSGTDLLCDFSGKVIYENQAIYGLITEGRNERYFVVYDENEKSGIVDKNGELLIPVEYDGVHYITENLLMVIIDGRYGVINENQEVFIPIIYDYYDGASHEEGYMKFIKDDEVYFFDINTGERI